MARKNEPQLQLAPSFTLVEGRQHFGVNPMMVETWLRQQASVAADKAKAEGRLPKDDALFMGIVELVETFKDTWQADRKVLLDQHRMTEEQ